MQRWIEEDGIWSADGIKAELKSARAQLWCFYYRGEVQGIWITRIDRPDSVAVGLIWGCAGNFVEHKDHSLACFGVIEDWLKRQGCKFVDIVGRDGWARIFHDYRRHAVMLRKRL